MFGKLTRGEARVTKTFPPHAARNKKKEPILTFYLGPNF